MPEIPVSIQRNVNARLVPPPDRYNPTNPMCRE